MKTFKTIIMFAALCGMQTYAPTAVAANSCAFDGKTYNQMADRCDGQSRYVCINGTWQEGGRCRRGAAPPPPRNTLQSQPKKPICQLTGTAERYDIGATRCEGQTKFRCARKNFWQNAGTCSAPHATADNKAFALRDPQQDLDLTITLSVPTGWSIDAKDISIIPGKEGHDAVAREFKLEKNGQKVWLSVMKLDPHSLAPGYALTMQGLENRMNTEISRKGWGVRAREGTTNVTYLDSGHLHGLYHGFTMKSGAESITLGRYAVDGIYMWTTFQMTALTRPEHQEALAIAHSVRVAPN